MTNESLTFDPKDALDIGDLSAVHVMATDELVAEQVTDAMDEYEALPDWKADLMERVTDAFREK